jgi:hypothetical protein
MELIAAGIFADGTVRYKYGSINSITDPLQLPTRSMQEQGRRCQSAANQMLAMAYEDSINGGARIGSSADRGLIGLYPFPCAKWL